MPSWDYYVETFWSIGAVLLGTAGFIVGSVGPLLCGVFAHMWINEVRDDKKPPRVIGSHHLFFKIIVWTITSVTYCAILAFFATVAAGLKGDIG